MESNIHEHPASFRDPEGQILYKNNELVRLIRDSGVEGYSLLNDSGLYSELSRKNMLIHHEEVESSVNEILIKPEMLKHISYSYEWSFSQLKDAALLTLEIQIAAIKLGMSLKDASAYNVQFKDGKAIFIDTSSFEKYQEGEPWVAYKQFCQHFLAPLSLMAKTDLRLNLLTRNYIDGIPLDLASSLLPFSTKFNVGISMHIHLHAKMQKRHAATDLENTKSTKGKVSKIAVLGILDSLKSTISKLKLNNVDTEWGDYYNHTNYDEKSFNAKIDLVKMLGLKADPKLVWDLGANRGVFSRVFSEEGIDTVAWDIDAIAVERNYLAIKNKNEKNLYPQLLDLMNPSPGIGWASTERDSFISRAKECDLTIALALIHHISISNNIPFAKVSQTFCKLGEFLLIEFVPKEDSQVKILLATRKDIFPDYNEEGFEKAFLVNFDILEKHDVPGSKRKLYLMKVK